MSKLKAKQRNLLPSSAFALPSERKYPIENRAHAANAKSRASQAEHAGRISAATKAKIDAKANRVLGAGHKQIKHGDSHEAKLRHG